jgi:hypothetical protein
MAALYHPRSGVLMSSHPSLFSGKPLSFISGDNSNASWPNDIIGLELPRYEMDIFSDLTYSPVIWGICIYFIFVGAWTIYSVYIGPLAKFPGPKLAAATLWYECYYDVFQGGQYTFKIKELHRKYGMSGKTSIIFLEELTNKQIDYF